MLLFGAILLLIPVVAMQITDEVNWDMMDFIVGGILIFGTIGVIEMVIRKTKENKYKIIIVFALIIAALIFWAEMAVGIFGSPIAGN